MNKLKQTLKNIFYDEPKKYEFSLYENSNESQNFDAVNNDFLSQAKVGNNIDENLKMMKIKYNALINSDVVIREFSVIVNDKYYKAFIIYIDGLSNSDIVNDYVLKPLMLRNSSNTLNLDETLTQHINNTVKITKTSKTDLPSYISNSLLPQNSIKQSDSFSEIASDINIGNCVLFIDTLEFAFSIDAKKFEQRAISAPQNEAVIKGPQEAFVENLRTNTALLRRTVNNENLIVENVSIGKMSKTKCGICYIKNIANSDLIAEVKYRLNNIELDSLLSSGQLEQLIENDNPYAIPQILSTERPDKVTKYLYEGRVAILVNGNPYCLVVPTIFIDYLTSPEDTNLKPIFANFLKVIRIFSLFITLLLPAFWIAITNFHQELIPTELLYSILSSRTSVPFPVIFEILVMEFSFELIREASIRVPSPVGVSIGIVGGLILGEAAVNANIVSPILIIIVALTGIASFAIPDFSFGFHIRTARFIFTFLAFITGFLGIAVGLFVYITVLCGLRSFGVSYMTPYSPFTTMKGNGYFEISAWKQEKRPDYLNTKIVDREPNISMKWKDVNGN